MDPEVIQRGRSYGGVGFICKKQNNISYRNVNVDSDRVSVVEVLYNHKTILTVVGVYMPFYNALADQIALYAETIDIVQNVLEIHSQCSPLMVMGDFFNATLPKKSSLHLNWYKSKPFNENSKLLYDFICENSLIVSNFSFSQVVDFTDVKCETKSYT